MRIKRIDIHNYRAFYRTHEIPVDGKNLLVYGENGSGKSSLYQAIESLFKAANQSVDIGSEGNLFDSDSPYVKIEMDTGDEFTYKDVSTLPQERFLIDINRHNPFFTYKRLLRTYLSGTAAQKPDLFSLLIETIVPYHANPQSGRTFGDEWQELCDALALRANSREYKETLNSTLPAFQTGLSAFLQDLTAKTNDWLNHYFKHNVLISFEPFTLDIVREQRAKTLKGNELEMDVEYFGNSTSTPYYEFLNEARLSALAVCMYLASLRAIFEPPDYKFLFLDDIFIGLDTSNRIPLLNILQNEFDEYQIFLTTYDKYWFGLAKDWFTRKTKDEWTFLEMYVDDQAGFEVPLVIPTKDYIKKAEDYLASHDYPACGIYLRKECEHVLSDVLKPAYRVKEVALDDKTKNYNTEQKNLNDRLLALKDFCDEEGLPYRDFEDLVIYKDVLLNPLSHHDIETPIYKIELQAIIDVLEKLQQIQIKVIPRTQGKEFIMKLEKSNGEVFSAEFKTREPMLLIKEQTTQERLMHCCKCEQRSIDHAGSRVEARKAYSSLQELYKDACQAFGVPESHDLLKIVSLRGKTLEDMISENSIF